MSNKDNKYQDQYKNNRKNKTNLIEFLRKRKLNQF